MEAVSHPKKVGLLELFLLFLKVGTIGFGGNMALVAVAEREIVEKKGYATKEQVIDAIALASILPGPVAVNTIAYIGYFLRGLSGTLVSVAGVILPSFFMIVSVAMVYSEFGHLPWLDSIFSGFLPAVVGIIASVALKLGLQHVKTPLQGIFLLIATITLVMFKGFIIGVGLIAGAALIGGLIFYKDPRAQPKAGTVITHDAGQQPSHMPIMLFSAAFVAVSVGLWLIGPIGALEPMRQLWVHFSGMCLAMFGGGYVFIPIMKEVVVTELGWLNAKEFADAIALGQVTPGPIVIAATFVGFRVMGLAGAVAATIAVFLPTALLTALCSNLSQRLANSQAVKASYLAIRPAVVGMIFAAAIVLARSIDLSPFSVLVCLASFVLTYRYKVDTLYVVPGAGLLGLLDYLF